MKKSALPGWKRKKLCDDDESYNVKSTELAKSAESDGVFPVKVSEHVLAPG